MKFGMAHSSNLQHNNTCTLINPLDAGREGECPFDFAQSKRVARKQKADPCLRQAGLTAVRANSLQPAYRVPVRDRVRDDKLKKWTVRARRRRGEKFIGGGEFPGGLRAKLFGARDFF